MPKHTAAEMGKSGQIRDAKPKTGQIGRPGRTVIFFRDTLLKIGTPENAGRMVTLNTD